MVFGGVWGEAETPMFWQTPPGALLGWGFRHFLRGLIENEGWLIDKEFDPSEFGGYNGC
jgi:hypothetical protein